MTPAGRLAAATADADRHAAGCTRCQPASVERPMTATCRTGLELDRAWMIAWRDTVAALTGVR